jgi:glycosyltransferase involved in cell wall biosynthesis
MRNAAIDKAAGEWIFTIDADERITPELREELERTLADPAASAYEIPRKAYFLGKWMKHCGWWPDYVLRLFAKKRGWYDDHLAHAKVRADGTTGRLRSPLLHIPYADLDEYIRKLNSHTNLIAREEGHGTTIAKACLRTIARFGQSYILKRGFLDGREGLVMSVLASYYVFVKYMKIWEAARRKP